jgi:hypothetical protein
MFCLLTSCVSLFVAAASCCCQVWKVEDGQSNKREILKLNFPESITPYFL